MTYDDSDVYEREKHKLITIAIGAYPANIFMLMFKNTPFLIAIPAIKNGVRVKTVNI